MWFKLLLQPFYGPLSGTTWMSWYQKGDTNLDLLEQDSAWQWHQLGYMQSCIWPQTDNHVCLYCNVCSATLYYISDFIWHIVVKSLFFASIIYMCGECSGKSSLSTVRTRNLSYRWEIRSTSCCQLWHAVFARYSPSNCRMTLKVRVGVTQGHRWCTLR